QIFRTGSARLGGSPGSGRPVETRQRANRERVATDRRAAPNCIRSAEVADEPSSRPTLLQMAQKWADPALPSRHAPGVHGVREQNRGLDRPARVAIGRKELSKLAIGWYVRGAAEVPPWNV